MQQAPEIRTAAQQTWQSARTRVQPVAEAAQSEIAAMRAPGAQEDAMAQLSEQFNTSKAQALKDGFNNFKDSIFNRFSRAPQAARDMATYITTSAADMATKFPGAARDAARSYGQGALQFYGKDVPLAAVNTFGRVSSSAQSLSSSVKSKLGGLKEKLSGLNPFSWGTKTPTTPAALPVEVNPSSSLVGSPYPIDSSFTLIGSPITPKSTLPSALVPYVAKGGALMPTAIKEDILPTMGDTGANAMLPQLDPKLIEAYLEGEKATLGRLAGIISQAAQQIPVPTIPMETVESYLETDGLMPYKPSSQQGGLYTLDGFAPEIAQGPTYGPMTEGQSSLLGSLRGFSTEQMSLMTPYNQSLLLPAARPSAPLIRSAFVQEPQVTSLILPEMPHKPTGVSHEEQYVDPIPTREELNTFLPGERPEYRLSEEGFRPTGISPQDEQYIDYPAEREIAEMKDPLLIDTAPQRTLDGTKKGSAKTKSSGKSKGKEAQELSSKKLKKK